jgi:hypothetical protein
MRMAKAMHKIDIESTLFPNLKTHLVDNPSIG